MNINQSEKGKQQAEIAAEKMNHAEIIECTYQNGQAECEYSFT